MSTEKTTIHRSRSGVWVILIAAIVLQAISCIQYLTSRRAIRHEAEQRAKTELRKAELEIELHTIEMETAAKGLALLAEKYVDHPDSIYTATRLAVSTLRSNTSLAVAYIPDYFPKRGRYYEICSSRLGEDSIYTRNIGSAEHDYTQMEWFENGLTIDSCWWSEPYLDDSGSQTMVVSCSCPVHNKRGEVVAVVCVDLSLDYLQDISEYLQVYPNSYYSILSSKGVEIVPAPDTIAGRKYNTFHEEIDATGWHIEIIIPEDVLFADLNRTSLLIGILMLLGMALLIVIVWYTSRSNQRLMESTAKNQRMEGELRIASMIQTAMLPKVFPPFKDRSDLNIYGLVAPAKEVGGDLYDVYVRQEKLYFCIGDVSGKGVPAALVMAMTRSLFRNITVHEDQPAVIMRKMNRALVDQNAQNMFLTLFLGVLDCETGQLEYCNAGHNAPVIVKSEELRVKSKDAALQDVASAYRLEVVANLPLGIEPEYEFTAQTTQLQYDDILFLYTDGLTEAENSQHEQFGEERMMRDSRLRIRDYRLGSPWEIVQGMKEAVEAFRGEAEQSDDLTMLAIRYQRPALIMRNDIQQIPTLAEWVEGLDIPEELNMPINLALEELVSNVMLYAYPGKSGQVLVESGRRKVEGGEKLIFTITDSGIPFDPTKKEDADITLSAEEREIGGLGIHLVRQVMDEIYYRREEERNVLTIVKNL